MIEMGIVDSGDSLEMGIGVMTDAQVEDFYTKMVEAGVIADGIDWKASFTTEFVGKGLGLDLRPKN
jgi:NitT/TauT family transport system substrate-binding protein